MAPDSKQTPVVDTDVAITHIRSSLLILAQTGEWSDLSSARSSIERLREQAEIDGHSKLASAVTECGIAIDALVRNSPVSAHAIYGVLDHVASVEAAFFDSSFHSDDFFEDLALLIDRTFDGPPASKQLNAATDDEPERFAIDEETLDIFRAEADELLISIDRCLNTLVASPSNSQAIWEIRRCAHTFKGAAGIVGYKSACSLAHRMEDLLDLLVTSKKAAGQPVLEYLTGAVNILHNILDGANGSKGPNIDGLYSAAIEWFGKEIKPAEDAGLEPPSDVPMAAEQAKASPVIRVAVDRLDHLLELSKKLAVQSVLMEEQIAAVHDLNSLEPDQLQRLAVLFENARDLNRALESGLKGIRMVRFGTIETRLSRAINNACYDENKKASLTLVNGDIEIDTLVIDTLIEPLIHLLKNAVVHGIEAPETRRLIGKPEAGRITVQIDADAEAIVLTVADDGCGISVSKLKEKALANGLIAETDVSAISDRDALKLIFEQGLTTADRIDLNAGRGVGMAIVKECIECHGGTVLVESIPQNGTTFTILLPAIGRPERPAPSVEVTPVERLDPLILIVDDSSTIRNQAVKIVANAGYRTITANNGAEALELLLSGKWEPDLILSDVEMPQIDGWQFLEYVKTDENLGQIPIIMITSLDLPSFRKRALDLGAAEYMVKPVSRADLERACRETIGP